MSRHPRKLLPSITQSTSKLSSSNALLFYALVVFIIRFADAIMSYITPIYVNEYVSGAWMMGIIIATSSVIGFACDILFGEWFANKQYSFFVLWGLIIALLFPLSLLLLPPVIPVLLLTMTIWGVYFELIRFADFHFINGFLTHQYHAIGWGILYAFIAAAYMIAPSIASLLLSTNDMLPLYAALVIYIFALIAIMLLINLAKKRQTARAAREEHIPQKNIFHQLKLWNILLRSLWPILLFVFTLNILDAAFWTSGTILSEAFKDHNLPGGIIFVAYLSPALFMSVLIGKIARPFGKKKAAYAAGLFAGLMYTIAGLANTPIAFLITVFIGSIFVAIALPEITGTVEDYIDRLGHSANSMIGLENSMSSLAWVVGPILAGFIASSFNHQVVFTVIGVMLVLVSLITNNFTPRKIRLPQQAIHRLEDMLRGS